MTVVQNPGRLEIVFALPGDKTRRESIMNIRPAAADRICMILDLLLLTF
jgi:hypothetical protein